MATSYTHLPWFNAKWLLWKKTLANPEPLCAMNMFVNGGTDLPSRQ